MKAKYRIRNIFFPHKHRKVVHEIKYNMYQIKLHEDEIAKIRKLARHGILGDSLWNRLSTLFDSRDLYIKKNKELKRIYKEE